MSIKDTAKLKVFKIFLWILGIFLFFWWPLSHWLYSDFYHTLLGFTKGQYPDHMVKVIGTTGFIPVLLAFLTAKNPVRNRDAIIVLIVFAILNGLTYGYLVLTNQFPRLEYINAGFSFASALALFLLYPWHLSNK